MPAAYDKYDYIKYWVGRDYEHQSEVLAIKAFLQKIKKINTTLEIGAGFGRLMPSYGFRAKKIILSDPSSKTLKVARESYADKKNVKYIHSSLENLTSKVRPSTVSLIVMVRVFHHIEDANEIFKITRRLLEPNGYFIFEFANKAHIKATLREFFKGNFRYLKDHTTTDIRSKKNIKNKTIRFQNYHPAKITKLLKDNNFEVIETRSVSNVRSPFLKTILPTDLLVSIDGLFQHVLSYISFGPSIFVLARKRG